MNDTSFLLGVEAGELALSHLKKARQTGSEVELGSSVKAVYHPSITLRSTVEAAPIAAGLAGPSLPT
jgi:hypothetical protein